MVASSAPESTSFKGPSPRRFLGSLGNRNGRVELSLHLRTSVVVAQAEPVASSLGGLARPSPCPPSVRRARAGAKGSAACCGSPPAPDLAEVEQRIPWLRRKSVRAHELDGLPRERLRLRVWPRWASSFAAIPRHSTCAARSSAAAASRLARQNSPASAYRPCA
jgi:hypothetical protein